MTIFERVDRSPSGVTTLDLWVPLGIAHRRARRLCSILLFQTHKNEVEDAQILECGFVSMSDEIANLITSLSSSDAADRISAAERLSQLGDSARDAAVALVSASGDDDEVVREWATGALEELGPPMSSDVAALADLLSAVHADVGYWAATLLGRLEEDAASAVAQLRKALTSHPSGSVRQRAAWALGKIGPKAAAAIDDLRRATSDDDPRLARLAERAIEQIGC